MVNHGNLIKEPWWWGWWFQGAQGGTRWQAWVAQAQLWGEAADAFCIMPTHISMPNGSAKKAFLVLNQPLLEGHVFFFAIPISYLFYATQHAPGGNKLWKFAARVSSRLQHWLEICNSVWVKLVDCHGLHKATDPCNFRYVLRVISMYLSSDQFWANSFDPYSAFRKASYIILHNFTIFYLLSWSLLPVTSYHRTSGKKQEDASTPPRRVWRTIAVSSPTSLATIGS